jgi:hypothetical protein
MDEVSEVFEYWKIRLNKPKSKLDKARARKIQERLKDGYTVQDLQTAVDGCSHSAFHNGDNSSRTSYLDISLICRDAEHVDRFVQIEEDYQKKQKSKALYQARLNS